MLNKLFKIKERQSTISKEVVGGLITFLTMSYIVAVNPNILSLAGMPKEALITTTCLAAIIGTLLAGLWANAPFAMAPGMGLNAMFTFTLVLSNGASWQEALGVVFISGAVFFVLSLTGFRNKVVDAIPLGLRFAIGAGIGLFIAFIGMKSMGLIVAGPPETLVTAGKFNLHAADGTHSLNIPLILAVVGLLTTVILEIKKIKGAILIGIILTTLLACIFDPHQILPTSIVSLPPSIAPIALKLNILGALKFSMMGAIFSFMFVDLFDSVGTIVGCSYQAGLVDKDEKMPHMKRMLEADAFATVVGALLGTSTTTTFVESSAGIAGGARTGLSSVITASLFFIIMFFAPSSVLFRYMPQLLRSLSLEHTCVRISSASTLKTFQSPYRLF